MQPKNNFRQFGPYLIAISIGMIYPLGFSPFNLPFIPVLCYTAMLGLWLSATIRQATCFGFLTGLGATLVGSYWLIYPFIAGFSSYSNGIRILLTVIIMILIATVHSIFPALHAYCVARFFRTNSVIKILVAFPVLGVLTEWARERIFEDTFWFCAGYSQIDTPLSGYAIVGGVYAVLLVSLLTSGLLILAGSYLYRHSYNKIFFAVGGIILLWLGGSLLKQHAWVTPIGPPLSVALVQGNVSTAHKWTNFDISLNRYKDLTAPLWSTSKIIIWPESAIPGITKNATIKKYINDLAIQAKANKTTLITGAVIDAGSNRYYNAVIMVGPQDGIYLKHRLFPFGEYLPPPLSYSNTLTKWWNFPMTTFIPGISLTTFSLENIKMGIYICNEILYTELAQQRHDKANGLLVVSLSTWFGHSTMKWQYLQMAQMRALELQRPMLIASNSGVTAIINRDGSLQAVAPTDVPTVLSGAFQPVTGETPWQQYGFKPLLFLLFMVLIGAYSINRKVKDT